MPKVRGPAFVQASKDLSAKSGGILRRWEQMCCKEILAAKEIDVQALRDSIPKFLSVLINQLAYEPEPHAESAAEHGEDRASQDPYSLDDMVHEYRILRTLINEALQLEAVLDRGVAEFINDFIDRGIAIAVKGYLSAEKKEAEAAGRLMQAQQTQLTMALENANAGTWHLDIPNGHIYASKEVAKIYGVDWLQQEDLSKAVARLVSEADRQLISDGIKNSIENNVPFSVEFRIRRADGEIRWSSARGRVEYDKDGRPLRLSGIQTDITDRMEILEDLKEAKSEADRANLAKSAFLANMSHEIRTPLGAIMGFSDLLTSADLTSADRANFVSIIDRNAKHALRIIDDILDLSKVEAGKIVIEHLEVHLPEVLADFSSLMGLRAKEKGIEFELRIPAPIPNLVYTDPTRLRQILNNAVSNAIKFTERGRVQLAVSFNDSILEFVVSDTGIGIDVHQTKQLFQPFHQADVSTTRRFGGTGLGLILTLRLAEAMGGTFQLEHSKPGRGSVFTATIRVTLPKHFELVDSRGLEFVARPTPSSNLGADADTLRGLNLLVVEDSIDNQVLLKLLLSKVGAKVEIASDGFEGVNKALAQSYDLILMDVQMPRMDGYEAAEELRHKGLKTPIIALTAHAMKEERERALASGFDDFLSKPIQRDALMETLLKFKKAPPRLFSD